MSQIIVYMELDPESRLLVERSFSCFSPMWDPVLVHNLDLTIL